MDEVYVIKQNNSDYKMAVILSFIMLIVGCGMLTCSGWKEIFFGGFFVLGSIVLIYVAISRKKTLEKLLKRYLHKKLKEYFKSKNSILRFAIERRKKVAVSYYIYVNGYVNKEDFELFMQKFKEEIGVKMEHRLLRKPANSIN
ncbi:MAG: hypothetical protein IKL68_06065 [Clostridia bacterium]|nr:hypothetical protein [Clostridia bacterium]